MGVNPDAVMAEMPVGVVGIVTAATDIMALHPMVMMTPMPGHPHPVITFMPVPAAMIIRPVPNTDREIDRFGLLHQRCSDCRSCCEKNQNFSFHTVFD